jgi:hypothetical protein
MRERYNRQFQSLEEELGQRYFKEIEEMRSQIDEHRAQLEI